MTATHSALHFECTDEAFEHMEEYTLVLNLLPWSLAQQQDENQIYIWKNTWMSNKIKKPET